MKKQTLTPELLYSISDNAHFLGGACAVLASNLLGFKFALIGAAIIIAFAAVKEAFIDPITEDNQVAGSGLRDFLGYFFGALVALGLAYLKTKF